MRNGRKVFNKRRFSITTASDGEQAIVEFSKDTFDLILLDIMMPNLDGLEAMKIIREKSSVPIFIMSAKDQDVDKALDLGLEQMITFVSRFL